MTPRKPIRPRSSVVSHQREKLAGAGPTALIPQVLGFLKDNQAATGLLGMLNGGGGGLASTGDYGQLRMTMGKKKAEQIRHTGAKVVATNCFNCMTQIRDLNKAYKLNVDVRSIVELVAESLNPNVA